MCHESVRIAFPCSYRFLFLPWQIISLFQSISVKRPTVGHKVRTIDAKRYSWQIRHFLNSTRLTRDSVICAVLSVQIQNAATNLPAKPATTLFANLLHNTVFLIVGKTSLLVAASFIVFIFGSLRYCLPNQSNRIESYRCMASEDPKSNTCADTILEMTYGRRNFIAYRGGATGTVVAPSRSLANYRNKIAGILGVTVLYTAFLYNSGTGYSRVLCLLRLDSSYCLFVELVHIFSENAVPLISLFH